MNLSKNLPTLIDMAEKNKVIDKNVSDILKSNFLKFKNNEIG